MRRRTGRGRDPSEFTKIIFIFIDNSSIYFGFLVFLVGFFLEFFFLQKLFNAEL